MVFSFLTHWMGAEQIELRKEVGFDQLRQSLNLFEDENGILRLRGRFERTELSYNEKYSIILRNGRSHITRLLVLDFHAKLLYQGTAATLGHLRLRF